LGYIVLELASRGAGSLGWHRKSAKAGSGHLENATSSALAKKLKTQWTKPCPPSIALHSKHPTIGSEVRKKKMICRECPVIGQVKGRCRNRLGKSREKPRSQINYSTSSSCRRSPPTKRSAEQGRSDKEFQQQELSPLQSGTAFASNEFKR